MGTVTRTYTFFEDTTAFASEINVNENILYTLVNGNIDSANILASGVAENNIQNSAISVNKVQNSAITRVKIETQAISTGSNTNASFSSTGLNLASATVMNITTVGKPVLIRGVGGGSAPSLIFSATGVLFEAQLVLRRNDTAVQSFLFAQNGAAQLSAQFPVSIISYVDNPASGVNRYEIAVNVKSSSTRVDLVDFALSGYELA